MNFLLQTDSYKVGHAFLYPPDLRGLYAYFESRGGVFDETVFFGLQGIIKRHLQGRVFHPMDISDAKAFFSQHFGRDDYFPEKLWRDMYTDYDGKLPILIKAVPEGTVVPTHNVLFTVENTDPKYAFIVGFVETLLMHAWYPITIASQSKWIKDQIRAIREKASDNLDGLEFMVHDFGYRGCTSQEQAEVGGAAHLLSFHGTDTLAGIEYLNYYYGGDQDNHLQGTLYDYQMMGFSVPALEHSIVLSFDSEEECFRHLLDHYPTGIVAAVSDTRDIYNAVNNLWGEELYQDVVARNGTLVVRPDSGRPDIVVPIILNMLWDRFGGTINSKGYRVIDPHVRVIQGDGMNRDSIVDLYDLIVHEGFAPENLTVGAGGGMLQGVNRDTQRFAYKVSEVTRGERRIPVKKTPITDLGKSSKEGRLVLLNDGLGTEAKNLVTEKLHGYNHMHDLLRPVFCNGEWLVDQTYDEIVARMR